MDAAATGDHGIGDGGLLGMVMRKGKKSESVNPRMDHQGEFDELFLTNAYVHIERMGTRAFWIGIETPDGKRFCVNTGVYKDQWFFNVQEDQLSGEFWTVTRPACHRKHNVRCTSASIPPA